VSVRPFRIRWAGGNRRYPAEPNTYGLFECQNYHLFISADALEGTSCPMCRKIPLPIVPLDQYPCKHCYAFLKDHAGRSCLFAPTSFEPMTHEELNETILIDGVMW